MLPAFYLLGVAVYQIYYQSFERRGQDTLRGLAFFFGLLFVTEVGLIWCSASTTARSMRPISAAA